MELTDLTINSGLDDSLLLSLWNTENTPTVTEVFMDEEDAYALYKVINELFVHHLTRTSLVIGRGYIFTLSNIDDNITLKIIDALDDDKEYRYNFKNRSYSSDYCSKQIIAPKLKVIEEKLHSYLSRIK